jgi:hypothetical protein
LATILDSALISEGLGAVNVGMGDIFLEDRFSCQEQKTVISHSLSLKSLAAESNIQRNFSFYPSFLH